MAKAVAGTSRGAGYDFGEVDLIPLVLDQGEVNELVGKYAILAQFEVRAAQFREVACRPPPGYVAVYKDQFMAGLRRPIPSFLFQILTFSGILIT